MLRSRPMIRPFMEISEQMNCWVGRLSYIPPAILHGFGTKYPASLSCSLTCSASMNTASNSPWSSLPLFELKIMSLPLIRVRTSDTPVSLLLLLSISPLVSSSRASRFFAYWVNILFFLWLKCFSCSSLSSLRSRLSLPSNDFRFVSGVWRSDLNSVHFFRGIFWLPL